MNSIAHVRASLARLVDRHLAAGLASEGVYIASGATLLRGVSSDLANGNVDALERLATRGTALTVGATADATQLASTHAAGELALIADDAAQVARGTRIRASEPGRLSTIWRGLVERISPTVMGSKDPGGALLQEQDQIDRIITTEWWAAYNAQRTDVERALVSFGDSATYKLRDPQARLSSNAKDWIPAILKRWNATLDKRTCPTCAGIDGEILLLGQFFDKSNPPVHPRCRCVVGYWPIAIPKDF